MKSSCGLVILSLWLFTACSSSDIPAPPSATPIPAPPIALRNLPAKAKMACSEHPVTDQALIYVWEYPGIEPSSNDDSDIQSVTGRSKGLLADCTSIMITRYEWSKTDREYYVYAKAGDVEGWVILHLVSLSESNP